MTDSPCTSTKRRFDLSTDISARFLLLVMVPEGVSHHCVSGDHRWRLSQYSLRNGAVLDSASFTYVRPNRLRHLTLSFRKVLRASAHRCSRSARSIRSAVHTASSLRFRGSVTAFSSKVFTSLSTSTLHTAACARRTPSLATDSQTPPSQFRKSGHLALFRQESSQNSTLHVAIGFLSDRSGLSYHLWAGKP